jgi:hypothetical protein
VIATILTNTIIVFRRDSPATRSRRSIGSGGESSSILTSVEGMQYRRSQKEIISYLIVLHSVGGLVSMMFTHPMLSFKCRMTDCYALYTVVYMKSLFTYYTDIISTCLAFLVTTR